MAQLFGITKEVIKAFKDLYPELIEESSFRTAVTISFISGASLTSINIAGASYARDNPTSSTGDDFSVGGSVSR